MAPEIKIIRVAYEDAFYLTLRHRWYLTYDNIFVSSRYLLKFNHSCDFETMNGFKSCLQFWDHATYIFKVKKVIVVVHNNQLFPEQIRKYLAISLLKEYYQISIRMGVVDSEYFDYLMENVNLDKKLLIAAHITTTGHPNALKFRSFEYLEARWVTLDDLKSIQNKDFVTLVNTIFTCEDINDFILFWIKSENDLMEGLNITLADGVVLDTDIILKGIPIIKSEKLIPSAFFFLGNENQKKFSIGTLVLDHECRTVSFEVFERQEYFNEVVSSLKLKEKKIDLEKRKTEINRIEEEGLKNWNLYIRDQKIKETRLEKEAIEAELDTIRNEFFRLGISDNQ
ncbi:hypothetical protein B9Z55_004701 [Caenorhabditis nigoni]|uniref:Sdz-33 F-box domain-containing protein n=1 Tax=Caenorhabditis nigoni TaxID=1611254 RepID=A0A2G5UXP1_9PELO|nr:hypothetical protein B9Z55_004701 [Caenorhabditis nigoni]